MKSLWILRKHRLTKWLPVISITNKATNLLDSFSARGLFSRVSMLVVAFLFTFLGHAQSYILNSPDNKFQIKINIQSDINFSIVQKGREIVSNATISMTLDDGTILGKKAKVKKVNRTTINKTITPVVAVKNNEMSDDYNQIKIHFRAPYSLSFRAYNDAFAYRFETDFKHSITITDERFDFQLPTNTKAWFSFFPYADNVASRWMTSYEQVYHEGLLDTISIGRRTELPLLLSLDDGKKLMITESDLRDYPGLYLKTDSNNILRSALPPRVKTEHENVKGQVNWDRVVYAESVYDYLAHTNGNRTFPWRLIAVAEQDIDLLNNEIVYKLAEPNKINNSNWIKPGQVQWDWWNDWNISNVNFKAGINTDTYKYYIDFASKNKIPYIIMDDGWYELGDLTKVQPYIDMPELVAYAKNKNVGIILWTSWYTLNQQMEKALDLFESWGIKGIKVDFMNRDDQDVVNFYWKTAEEAAKRHMIVNFHGSHKPAGLHRTFPNVLNYEGVAGLEMSKFVTDKGTPDMAVTIPYIRMFTGPMDYTPGAMRNATKADFRPVNSMPMSQGTRVQQLAMYVLYDAPLQMLCDNPTAYVREKQSLDFITSVPTTWDKTVPLAGEIGQYIVMARKKGDEYFIGAMTNWEARDLEIDLSFLPSGKWKMQSFSDGMNADRDATDYTTKITDVHASQSMKIHLSPGGGWAARITME